MLKPRFAPRLASALRGFCTALALLLGGCHGEDIKRAPLAIGKSISGELFWFDQTAKTLIVVTGGAADGTSDDMAAALAWPDRLVLVLSDKPAARAQSCRDLVGQATAAARSFALKTGRPPPERPIVVGLDGTSAMSFALSARPQDASAVVALGYCPDAAPPHPVCAGAPGASRAHNPIPLVAIPAEGRCTTTDLGGMLSQFDDARAVTPVGGPIELMASVVSQVIGGLGANTGGALDLPLIELPATGKDDRLAVILSGDGGWTDIDRELGEDLAKRGVAVVGVNTLKYFWRRKDPAEAAAALERVMMHYAAQWKRKRIVLVGYSFGADVLPFLWPHLSRAARAKVSDVALLALSPAASFEITVGGWVGVESREAVPTAPAIRAMKGPHVLCIQAGEDTDDPCPGLASFGVEAITVPGDHHFDGDYKRLSDIILARSAR